MVRAAFLCLVLAIPLLAADPPPFATWIAQWRSDEAATREAASQQADRELRRMLAPLIEAMEDQDPEVRLRARNALLALVPNEPLQEAPQGMPQAGALVLPNGVRNGQILQVWVAQQGQAGVQGQPIQLRLGGLQQVPQNGPWQKIQAAQQALGGTLGMHPRGALVLRVEKGGAAERLGLAKGDVILAVNGKATATLEALADAAPADWKDARLTIERRGEKLELPIVR